MTSATTRSAIDALATTCSVSFRTAITCLELKQVLETGVIPDRLRPHLVRTPAEAPIEMIERVVSSLGYADAIIGNLVKIATEVHALERIEAWRRG